MHFGVLFVHNYLSHSLGVAPWAEVVDTQKVSDQHQEETTNTHKDHQQGEVERIIAVDVGTADKELFNAAACTQESA